MLYYDLKIPVPDDARVYKSGSVMHLDKTRGGGKNPHKTVIGRLVEPSEVNADGKLLMHPNDKYRALYRDDPAANPAGSSSGNTSVFPPETIRVGLYAMVFGIAKKLGIYQMLCDVYDPEIANAVLDLAMFFLLAQSNSLNTIAGELRSQLLFSIRAHSDSWYSELLDGKSGGPKLTRSSNREFMNRWVEKRIAEGLSSIVYSMDTTSFVCGGSAAGKNAGSGRAKTGSGRGIAGAIEAVEAGGEYTGMPLAYLIHPGGRPDGDAVREMASWLGAFGLEAQLAVFDQGFSCEDALSLCEKCSLPCLVMLQGGCACSDYMVGKYGKTLRNDFSCRIPEEGLLLGTTEDDVPVSGGNKGCRACVGLFFDGRRAAEETNAFLLNLDHEFQRLSAEVRDLESRLRKNHSGGMTGEEAFRLLEAEGIQVPREYEGMIDIGYDMSSGQLTVEMLPDRISEKCDTNGFFCMAASDHMTARQMCEDYRIRTRSDPGFRMFRSQPGSEAPGLSDCDRLEAEYFCRHIAKMIRAEFANMCTRYEMRHGTPLDADLVIRQLNRITYTRTGSVYIYSGQASGLQLELLEEVGITGDILACLGPLVDAMTEESKIETLRKEMRVIPELPGTRKPGRPLGSKNKSTGSTGKKNYRGRKPGSKNKKTLEREAAEAAERERRIAAGLPAEEPKKGRGRKPGSKNKKTLEREAAEAAERERRVALGLPPEEPKPPKPHRGRAKGTKNKKTLTREQQEPADSAPIPGEPEEQGTVSRKGGKYQSTILQEAYDRELTEKTGIEIIVEDPPRPWTNAQRYQINKARAKRRKMAEAKLAEMQESE